MNKNQKIGFVMMAIGAITPIVLDHISHKIKLNKTIKAIDAETTAEVDAMRKASSIVKLMIENGYYENRSRADMEKDFEFFRMAVRYND
jgi:uncharacterized membrane protein